MRSLRGLLYDSSICVRVCVCVDAHPSAALQGDVPGPPVATWLATVAQVLAAITCTLAVVLVHSIRASGITWMTVLSWSC